MHLMSNVFRLSGPGSNTASHAPGRGGGWGGGT